LDAREVIEMDLLWVSVVLLFFGLSLAMVRQLERLR
jgi:hypothetical protein